MKLDPYSRKATDAQRRRAMAPLRYPMILYCKPTCLRIRCSDCWRRLLSQWRREDPTTPIIFMRYATEGGRCYGKAAGEALL